QTCALPISLYSTSLHNQSETRHRDVTPRNRRRVIAGSGGAAETARRAVRKPSLSRPRARTAPGSTPVTTAAPAAIRPRPGLAGRAVEESGALPGNTRRGESAPWIITRGLRRVTPGTGCGAPATGPGALARDHWKGDPACSTRWSTRASP